MADQVFGWLTIGDDERRSGKAVLHQRDCPTTGQQDKEVRSAAMAVFKKQDVYWIDYYVNGQRRRERIGPDKKLAQVALKKRLVERAEGKILDKKRPVTTTFDELKATYLKWIRSDEEKGIPARKRSWKTADVYAIGRLRLYFGGKRLNEITPAMVEQYRDWRRASLSPEGKP